MKRCGVNIESIHGMGNIMGVYVFYIGDKFYIGRSIAVKKRLIAHARKIDKCRINYSQYINDIDKRDRNTSLMYLRIARYMLDHPKIPGMRLDRVYKCETHLELCAKERQLLRLFEEHPDCINTSFHCSVVDKDVIIKHPSVRKERRPRIKKTAYLPNSRPTKGQLLKVLHTIRKKK